MPDHVAGFPYWEPSFDAAGKWNSAQSQAAFLGEVKAQSLTDLFLFAHGWNNDEPMARNMYEQFYQLMRALLDNPAMPKRRTPKVGTVGIIWPAKLWADSSIPAAHAGGAAGLGTPPTDASLVLDMKPLFPGAAQQAALDEMAGLMQTKPADAAALVRFHTLMATLATATDAVPAPEDNGEQKGLLEQDPLVVFKRFAGALPPARMHGGAAGLGDPFNWLWNGALQALRSATYWEMKKRAGTIGLKGLGPLVGQIAATVPGVHIHLIGHSFGARLVSFTIAGLPNNALHPTSPVKSVTLIQGAFSHFAFANALPMAASTPGALKGMMARIGGPLVVTHSVHDMAVGWLYPIASEISGDNASAVKDALYEWGAMGHDGAQAVSATELTFAPTGGNYHFTPSAAFNLDGDTLITQGGPPAGAHGDIFHSEIAWAVLAAAGIGGGP